MNEDLNLFIDEALESLDEIERNLMLAEKRTDDWKNSISIAFGAIHTIKGNSLYLDLKELSYCCQKMESMLAQEDRSPRLPEQEQFDVLFQLIDVLRDYCASISDDENIDDSNLRLKSCLEKIK